MNLRRFFYIIALVLSIFLFLCGVFILSYISLDSNNKNNIIPASSRLDEIIAPFKNMGSPVNILLLGGDVVNKNTDTMMLVHYNPTTAKANILSIPRDTKVQVKGSSIHKINSAYPVGGAQLAADTVSKLLNVNIKYTIVIDTNVFKEIIDLLGGVDYNIPVDMYYSDPLQNLNIQLKKGFQHMNGDQSLAYVRFRQPSRFTNEIMQYYDGSDLKRIDAQQNFLRELVRQKTNIRYITKLKDVISVLYKKIDTNISLSDALKLSGNAGKLKADEINMFKLPGNASNEETGSYYIYDKAATEEIIRQYFSGKSAVSGKAVSPAPAAPKSNNNSGGAAVQQQAPSAVTEIAPSPVPSKTPDAANPEKTGAPVDVTKGNPSNSESNLKGNTNNNP